MNQPAHGNVLAGVFCWLEWLCLFEVLDPIPPSSPRGCLIKCRISSVAVQKRTGTLGEAGLLESPSIDSPASAMLATWPTTLPHASTSGAPLEPGANSAVTFRKTRGRVNLPLASP